MNVLVKREVARFDNGRLIKMDESFQAEVLAIVGKNLVVEDPCDGTLLLVDEDHVEFLANRSCRPSGEIVTPGGRPSWSQKC